ncbi:MAG: HAD hydrolase family protein, partial [Dehalococcoidia bacterium]
MQHLISFDIDGTLVTGNGPGPITLEMVRRALAQGHIIGSCSDRPVQDQRNMWAEAGIEVSFT